MFLLDLAYSVHYLSATKLGKDATVKYLSSPPYTN